MVTLATSDLIIIDIENGMKDDSRPESDVNLTAPSNIAMEVQLPDAIEESSSGPSTNFELPKNDQNAMQPSNSNTNNDDVQLEEPEQKQLYEKCLKLIRVVAFTLGIRITHSWKPRKYFLFCFSCFFHVFCAFAISYTVYVHYVNGNFVRILEPLSIFGMYISCDLKMYGYVRHGHQMLALAFSVKKFFRPNVFGREVEVLRSSLQKTWTLLSVFTTGMCIGIIFFACTPPIVYFVKHEILLLMPIEIIFCDVTQVTGLVFATIPHMIMGYYAASVTLLSALIFMFCMSNYILQGNLIVDDFEKLDGVWNGINNISLEYKRAFLLNICKKREDMNHYLQAVKFIFETHLFIYFFCNYFSQIICLFNVMQNDWIGGYGPACGLFMEMMFYCYMGTQVSIVDDKLCLAIYNSNWYTYDLQSQRMICLLLHEAQQPKDLQLGVIGSLNLVTGITIIKSICYYYTVMTELF